MRANLAGVHPVRERLVAHAVDRDGQVVKARDEALQVARRRDGHALERRELRQERHRRAVAAHHVAEAAAVAARRLVLGAAAATRRGLGARRQCGRGRARRASVPRRV